MAEYIDREKACDAVNERIKELKGHKSFTINKELCINGVKKHIMSIPIADVKPIVHTHWIRGMFVNMICSNYNFPLVIYDKTINKVDYCPHCGTKMDELWYKDE